jgi:hypothetical protein
MFKLMCKTLILLSFFTVFAIPSHACGKLVFLIILGVQDNSRGFATVWQNMPGTNLSGTFVSCNPGCSGSTASFSGTTDGNGEIDETGHATPAYWRITFGPGADYCNGQSVTQLFQLSSSYQYVTCPTTNSGDNLSETTNYDCCGNITSVTMTDTNPWARTPSSYTFYDSSGNYVSSGSVTVVDNYNCTANMYAGQGTGFYLWLADSHNIGLGVALMNN